MRTICLAFVSCVLAIGQTLPPEILQQITLDSILDNPKFFSDADITTDPAGNVYISAMIRGVPQGLRTFTTSSTQADGTDINILVAKLDPSLTQVIFATVIGSERKEDLAGMAVNESGEVYITGYTRSAGFPQIFAQTRHLGLPHKDGFPDGFVLKLNAAGDEIVFNTLLGSGSIPRAIDLDSAGSIYVGGQSGETTFEPTSGVYKPFLGANGHDPFGPLVFLVKLDADASEIVYATSWGNAPDALHDLDVRPDGDIYFTTSSGAVAVLDSTASTEVFAASTSFRSYTGVVGPLLAFDASGNLYVTGTDSVNQTVGVVKFGPDGNSVYSQTLGDAITAAFTVTSSGQVHLFPAPRETSFETRNTLRACLANLPPPMGNAGLTPFTDFGKGAHGVLNPNGEVSYVTYAPITLSATISPLDGSVLAVRTNQIWDQGPEPRVSQAVVRINPDFDPTFGIPDPLSIGCIGHGATYEAAPLSPGALMVLYGSHLGPGDGVTYQTSDGHVPLELAGITITVDGAASPVVYAQDKQVNFFIPWQVRTDGELAEVCIHREQQSDCVSAGTAPIAPGIVKNGEQSLALNEDGTLNSPDNRAAKGSLISFFVMGAGTTSGQLTDGAVATAVEPVDAYTAVWFVASIPGGCGFVPCGLGFRNVVADTIESASSPGFVQGFVRVTIRIPDEFGQQSLRLRFTHPETREEFETTGRVFVQ